MAEFKLGRIRFVWKNQWTASTTYYVDDVVRFGGKIFICRVGHTASSNFYTDSNFNPTRWEQMADGQLWKDNWIIGTFYSVNDIVKYGGLLYIANTPHTSAATLALGLENDLEKWDVFAESFDWKDTWTVETRYKINDLVRYGGYTYICNQGHISATTVTNGLELDQNKWDTFNPGIEYKGTWSSVIRYKINDVVKQGANLWICVDQHTSTADFVADSALYWEVFVEGFEFEDDWSEFSVYQSGDVVRYGGNQYVSLTNHSGENPLTSTTNWSLFSQGFRFIGEWDSLVSYKIGSVVTVNSYSYLATNDNLDSFPPSNDWERLNSGVVWTGNWSNASVYRLGDIVKLGTNAYICIAPHISNDTINDPIIDINGDFWNLFSTGTETSVLTTQGDLVYFGGSGPTRLPLGREGQVLRSNGIDPEWATFGDVDQVYYVATHGQDLPSPIWGKNWDKPYKSVRYACEQVDYGPRNPNAQYLLELNRAFIQREITEYIENQIINAVVGSIWENFQYNTEKCERDIGFTVDSIIWDIGHGGNVRVRNVARTLINAQDEGPISTIEEYNSTGPYGNSLAESEQSAAAYSYFQALVNNVLSNTAPVTNYQTLNGDNSTAVVSQYINTDFLTEPTAFTETNTLINVIITALNTQSVTSIPKKSEPNVLIRVATGRYRETLPIIVPANTCIIGDELRSTNIGAAGSLIDDSDSFYTVGTFDYITNVVSNIVTGNAVTPTTGNVVTQSQEFPFADTDESSAVKKLVQAMKYQSDYRLDTMHVSQLTDPLVGFDLNARKLIQENKQYLKEEVITFLAINYPTLRYGKTKTRRDTGYIIDAIIYDLTYGGNALSVQAGLAYWDGDDNENPQIPASIKAATLDSIEFLKTRLTQVAGNSAHTALQTAIPRFIGTAGAAGDITLINNNLDDIIEIVNNGPVNATYTLVDATPADGVNSTTALIAAYASLDTNTATIVSNTISWIDENYPNLEYDGAKYSRDIGIVLKAVGFDFMFDSHYQTIKVAHAYLRNTDYYFTYVLNQKDIIRKAIEYALSTLAVANVNSDVTAIARINASAVIIDNILFSATNEGEVLQAEARNTYHAVLQLERNREFIVSEVGSYVFETYRSSVTSTSGIVLTTDDTSWMQRNTAVIAEAGVFGLEINTTYYIQNVISDTEFSIAIEKNSNSPIDLGTNTGLLFMGLEYRSEAYLKDVELYIDAIKWDLVYNSNYKSRFAARYYANAIIGSREEDMYYLRDSTGLRNHTVDGLNGDLTPPNEFGTSRVTAGAYASLDPGWGPADIRTWITNRSPYVQNITTFGNAATGQKIDGALHNGGNDSIVSNDFTQVISDGIGAWIANNGRAELVSVFSYYAHIAYLATEGGRIRATNGNNSYGEFGSVAEGVDDRETPQTAEIDNRSQFTATVGSVFTRNGTLASFEFENAGVDYTEAAFFVTGGGVNAVLEANEFRNNALFEVRLLDNAPVGEPGMAGGQGYLTAANTAQGGSPTTIIIAQVDSESDTAYVGMKIIITGGTGSGQFGIITSYNSGTKVAEVGRQSDNQPGFDHVIPGTLISNPDGSSTYTIEPTVNFTAPPYSSDNQSTGISATDDLLNLSFVKSTARYLAVTGTASIDGIDANFNIIKRGTKYRVFLAQGGTGYTRLETVTILGSTLGGTDTTNNLVITVTSIDSVTGTIQAFDFVGISAGGNFVATQAGATDAAVYWNGGTDWAPVSGTLVGPQKIATGAVLIEIDAVNIEVGEAYIIKTPGDSAFNAIGAPVNFTGQYFIATGTGTGTGKVTAVKDVAVAVVSGSAATQISTDGGVTWVTGGTLPSSTTWSNIAYGQGRWVAIASGGTASAYSVDGGVTWTAGGALPASANWTALIYGAGKFVAISSGTNNVAYSVLGGEIWVAGTGLSVSDWTSVTFGNNRFVAVSNSTTDIVAYSLNGIAWLSSTLPESQAWTSIVYSQGVFVAVAETTIAATSENGITWTPRAITNSGSTSIAFGDINQQGVFTAAGAITATKISVGAITKARAFVSDNRIFSIRITEPGSNYTVAPTMTITDPNEVFLLPFELRIGNGVLANPSFVNRGTQFATANAEINKQLSDGVADFFQPGTFIAVRRISERPALGSNITFDHLPDRTFKLVQLLTFVGSFDGSYSAFYQISPPLTVSETAEAGVIATTRIRYSQVRLTGHDFLDIGTGGFTTTNYPDIPLDGSDTIPANETQELGGGRVFFTSTDQDGNFRVGDLFSIEQSTGVATLNADAFNISGLQELNLGNVTLGGGSATVTEFSTDPFFTADSDNVVPTQRAIKAFIASQIGGGGATLNVNKIIAGNIEISSNQIFNVTGESIKMGAIFEFRGGVIGYPVAWNFFLN